MGDIDFSRTALSKTAATFIATFLRFEFALKEAGFGPRNGAALVEWGRVANELGPDFLKAIGASGSATTILQKPPKKQITREHSLEWEDANRQSKLRQSKARAPPGWALWLACGDGRKEKGNNGRDIRRRDDGRGVSPYKRRFKARVRRGFLL